MPNQNENAARKNTSLNFEPALHIVIKNTGILYMNSYINLMISFQIGIFVYFMHSIKSIMSFTA